MYIVWVSIKSNETTFSGQLWPLFLTKNGQNDKNGWRNIQIRNPHIEAVLMMYISGEFWWNSLLWPLVVSCDHCFWPKLVKTVLNGWCSIQIRIPHVEAVLMMYNTWVLLRSEKNFYFDHAGRCYGNLA